MTRFTLPMVNEECVFCLYNSEDPAQMIVNDDANLFVGQIREFQIRVLAPETVLHNFSKSFYKLEFDYTGFSNIPDISMSHDSTQSNFVPSPQFRRNIMPQTQLAHAVTDITSSPKHMSLMLKDSSKNGLSIAPNIIQFINTEIGARDTVRIEFKNHSSISNTIYLNISDPVFSVNCAEYRLDTKKLVRISIHFEPRTEGVFHGILNVHTSAGQSFQVPLHGKAIPSSS